MNWSEYQNEVASFFNEVGGTSAVDVEVVGARAKHKIDVLVRFKLMGIDLLWVVECKYWKAAIPKEKVLALQMQVQDVGADRGFLMSESGFQSGAIRCAEKSNVTLTSLEELKTVAKDELVKLKYGQISLKLNYLTDRFHTFIPWVPGGKVAVLGLLEHLPKLFMIRLQLSKAINNAFPFDLYNAYVRTPDEFVSICGVVFESASQAIMEVETQYNAYHKEGLEYFGEFKANSSRLFDLAEQMASETEDERKRKLRLECVEMMKDLREMVTSVRKYFTIRLYDQFSLFLNREIYNGIYIDLTKEDLLYQDVALRRLTFNNFISRFERDYRPIAIE